ncbi:hypothetical protein PN36_21165 [Candidatus Thiomargarita nelsonii]|uniref:Nucleotidyltransferase n=1 Tax=Candidatus Thiomargarita nelsonii TaxID=1003181 RepID=A0A0A6PMB1_9GAMM|nr:hypothetical protein PN36_21165 [Candidatus Thiomargarita nelsonii]
MTINVDYLNLCIQTLEGAFVQLQQIEPGEIAYNIYRAACVKEFEINIFRHAAKHALIDIDTCERWFEYRNNRNNTAHDYGEPFAESTLKLLPSFITDAKALTKIIETNNHD